MRVRPLLLWFLVPGLLLVTAAGWVVARATIGDRAEVSRMAAQATRSQMVEEAYTWSMAEIQALIGLGAIDPVPPQLRSVSQTAGSSDRTGLLRQLELAESEGAKVMARLRASGPVPEAMNIVLGPIDPAIKQRIAAGERSVVDGRPYEQAYSWVTVEYADIDTRSEDALNGLLHLDERPAYWRSAEFLGFMAALALLSIVGSIVAMWRVTHAARHLDLLAGEAKRRAERAEARAEHMRLLIGTARRLTGSDETTEVVDVAANLVLELKQLLHCDTVVLAMAAESELRPIVSDGSLVPAAVRFGAGIAGRAAETGQVVRMVVTDDPMFPRADESARAMGDRSMSLLAAPIVLDGTVAGVLVAGSPSTQLLDADDESVVSLVALVGGGALRAAERYGTTLELTLRDPLTGLGNRRRLDRDLGTFDSSGPTAAVMVDIDHFKLLNDRYGHARGDDVLRAVGGAISEAVRSGDVAYRFGGEEFSVLLRDADEPTAMLIAERIRERVSSMTLPAGIGPVTVSVGVAVGTPGSRLDTPAGDPDGRAGHTGARPDTVPAPDGWLHDLVELADQALYAAKHSGRDRVRLHVVPDGQPVAGPT